MVVCKCRKATKLYCFVHKVPVCGECICFPEHQICVVRTYSEWVIDGEYDWPPKCCSCHAVLEEAAGSHTTRLGCLHVIHTSCLLSHIKSFPPHTAPAGYVCPTCSVPLWPPKSVKDSRSQLHSKLKESIVQSGTEKKLFGDHPVSFPPVEARGPPPAFSSEPLKHVYGAGGREVSPFLKDSSSMDSLEIDDTTSASIPQSNHEDGFVKSSSPTGLNATTRKTANQLEKQNSENLYYADDEDGNQKKYTRRGTLRNKFIRSLLPFWSSALPTLPVTAPPKKDPVNDGPEGRLRQSKSSRTDPRKLLLLIAILACMATMGILYYRIAQGGLAEELPGDEV